jgi:ankyrin
LLQSDGNTAFLRAARAGHLDKVLEHLKSNIDINTSNSVSTCVNTPYGMTPK